LIEKKELQEGVYMAGCLTRVVDGRIITSILNTRDEEIEIVGPIVEMSEIGNEDAVTVASAKSVVKGKSRDERVLEQLRTEHLNSEERKSLQKKCSDYQDVFYLPGDQLSCTNAVKHSINLAPGTTSINTRP
jgi:putative intracellular protease/amidase